MPKRSHDDTSIIDKLLKFAFFFLRDVAVSRIVTVFNIITVRRQRQATETIFEVAYLRRSEGII